MSAFDAYVRLDGYLSGELLTNERLSRHTTYRIGGPADLFITCETLSDLSVTLAVLKEEETPWVILGKGSNVLVSDDGYRGCVITLGKEFRKLERTDENLVTVGAGVQLGRLTQFAFSQGLSGMEFAVGIPGTVGGAVSMNAGTRDIWISSIVNDIVVYNPELGLLRRNASDIGWHYRFTTIDTREIILETTLHMTSGDKSSIRARMEASLNVRRRSQPITKASCGSVFRNTAEKPVAELIESCGLKGYRIGGAEVSPIHANFIVNNGSASANDVARVIVHVRNCVKEHYGIDLKPEVKFLGFPS